MKRILKIIYLYYFISHFKFFKAIKQTDQRANKNAKGFTLMDFGVLIVTFFNIFFYSKLEFLHKGGNFRFLGILLFLPIAYLMDKILPDTFYPNQEKTNLIRGILVSLTIPILFILGWFFL
ncbi:hypothetical protein SAMN05421847_2947 [Halpernia humi]|uniref:Uncharacterized protein n=1 Tax=Halpernia humi TaxID=493375 RepID=A0A1H6BK07_9FLAO|nr:hypothetical protein [Halpernia humi]SEG61061.1 hypothetical protein SAMN05421847_2947 [Halpernia humi]